MYAAARPVVPVVLPVKEETRPVVKEERQPVIKEEKKPIKDDKSDNIEKGLSIILE